MELEYITAATTVLGLIFSYVQTRAKNKAETRCKELENEKGGIDNASAMVELVKSANEEALEIQRSINKSLRTENEKFKRHVERFEKAVMAIGGCEYGTDCPVTRELRTSTESAPG